MSRLGNLAPLQKLGGVWILKNLRDIAEVGGSLSISLGKLEKGAYTRLCRAVGDGIRISRTDTASDLLHLLSGLSGVPKWAPIGYLGKKELHVLILSKKLEQYKTDLIAAGHMMDVDLTAAIRTAFPSHDEWWSTGEYVWLRVLPHSVRSKDTRAGKHLKPATSKMAEMIRSWGKDLIEHRREFLNWLGEKPTITWDLASGKYYIQR